MKKRFSVFLCVFFALSRTVLPSVTFADGNEADFAPDAVLVSLNPASGGFSLFSAECFKELGISEIKCLDMQKSDGFSLFFASEPSTLKLTLSEQGEENVLSAIERLSALPFIEYAEPDYFCELFSYPDDPYYASGSQYSLDKIGAPDVWNTGIDCSDVVAAFIDSGVDSDHADLAENIWVNGGEIPDNGIDDDNNGFIDDINGWNFNLSNNSIEDENGHGTHVAGIIGAVTDNGKGVASLTRSVKIMPVRIFGESKTTTISNIYMAVDYARTMGADVINMSFGTTGYSKSLFNALEKCTDSVLVAAAGNADSNSSPVNLDNTAIYPASFDLDNLISVANSDSGDNLSSTSNYGAQSVDIAAPGTLIYSTYVNQEYKVMSGTSMASPLVAAAAAVVHAAYPWLTPTQIKEQLICGADEVSKLSSKVMGGARLNAYGALTAELPTPLMYGISYDGERALAASPEAGNVCVIFAAYKNGAITDIEAASISFDKADLISVFPQKSFDDADAVKVMMWKSLTKMVPLASYSYSK